MAINNARSKLERLQASGARSCSPDRLMNWLDELNISEVNDNDNDGGLSEPGENRIELATQDAPATPWKKVQLVQRCEEVSPTNTSFSDKSVFDTVVRNRCQQQDKNLDSNLETRGESPVSTECLKIERVISGYCLPLVLQIVE